MKKLKKHSVAIIILMFECKCNFKYNKRIKNKNVKIFLFFKFFYSDLENLPLFQSGSHSIVDMAAAS